MKKSRVQEVRPACRHRAGMPDRRGKNRLGRHITAAGKNKEHLPRGSRCPRPRQGTDMDHGKDHDGGDADHSTENLHLAETITHSSNPRSGDHGQQPAHDVDEQDRPPAV